MEHVNEDRLLRASRISLWWALVFVAVIGAAMSVVLLGGGRAVVATRFGLGLLPVAIAIACAAIGSTFRLRDKASRDAMRVLMNDELRQHALAKGYRNAFAATLCAGAALTPALAIFEVVQPAAILFVATATTGIVALLGSVLYYDR